MPVYLDIFNLIIDKKAIAKKYSGGVEQFRKDYDIIYSPIDHEDDELFSLGQMNVDQFDIGRLISKGLEFDVEKQFSNDFTIVYRYGDWFWYVEWLKHNRVFAWHIDACDEQKKRVDELSKMTIDDVREEMEKGNNLLKPIRSF